LAAFVAVAAVPARSQVAGGLPQPLDIVVGLGLPAVDRGVVADPSRAPDSVETAIRGSIRATSSVRERVGASGARYVPGLVIVKFKDGVSTEAGRSYVAATVRSGSLTARAPYANFDVVQIDPSEDAEVVAAAFARRPDVEYAQAVHRYHALLVPNDPLYARLQWNLRLIDLERAWDIQPQAGSAVTVAVLDTGMAYTSAVITATAFAYVDDRGVVYPALGRLTLPYSAATQLGGPDRFITPHDFIWNSNTPLDFDGHGTHVSGTIGQLTNDGVGTAGVAFNVKLMPVKVLAGTWDVIFGGAPETGGTDDVVARGIRYAADNGAKVLNMSLGSAGPPGSAPVIEDAVRYAVGRGAVVVLAAGNDFEDGNPPQVLADIASHVNGAISVGAVDPLKQHAFYSSSGSFVELAAPGGSNRGFGDDGFVWQQTFDFNFTDTFRLEPANYGAPRFDVVAYVGMIGTSMAVAHVSGVAAMLIQQGITDPAAVEAAIEKFAVDLGSNGRDQLFGFGLVDARNTLRGLGLAR
jgi:serine protease